MSDKIDATSLAFDDPIRRALHDARIQRLCEGLQDTRIDWKDLEIERLKQALHDARIENSGQAAELEREKSRADAHCQNYLQMLERIDQLVAERRWIPVEERLPKTRDAVLTLWVSGMMSVKQYDAQRGWTTGAQVTHWMPLPSLPTEVQP